MSSLAFPAKGGSGVFGDELYSGPKLGANVTRWLENLFAWKARVNYPAAFNQTRFMYENYLLWTSSNYVHAQVMAHELTLFSNGAWTVQSFLDGLKKRFGGLDSVLLWSSYPNMGIDNRNQYDMLRCIGGGLKEAIATFHQNGVKVLIPYNPWDQGTRPLGQSDFEGMNDIISEFGADGFNGDTMNGVSAQFFDPKRPIVLEPEWNNDFSLLAYNKFGWGYWWLTKDNSYTFIPGVAKMRFLEPQHMTHVTDRFSLNKNDFLQFAYFNGAGMNTWENVWGIYNTLTDRDAAIVLRISTILRFFTLYFQNSWIPFSEHVLSASSGKGIFGSKWSDGKDGQLWTVINRAQQSDKFIIKVPVGVKHPLYCHDCYHGTKYLIGNAVPIEGGGFGCVICNDSNPNLAAFLTDMASKTSVPLNKLSTHVDIPKQRMVPIDKATNITSDMIHIPTHPHFLFNVSGVEIEGKDSKLGVDFQYPWESAPFWQHQHTLNISEFYVAKYPVTNAQYYAFLQASGYRPSEDYNYLKVWDPVTKKFPLGWDNKPVTWVSLEDARAYCKFYNVRLLNEWEWAVTACGGDYTRLYPWGSTWCPACVPPIDTSRTMRPPTDVNAYPQGASPFGVMDLIGNTYTWLNEFCDDHTCAAVLRGSGYYYPQGSAWYWQNATRIDQHAKYLLMRPSLDRSGMIGFRVAADP